MTIEVTKIRAGDVMYKVRVGDRDVYHADFEDLGRLVATALSSIRLVDEMRYSREGLVLYVYVPEDVSLESIDRKATEVYEAWKATLKP